MRSVDNSPLPTTKPCPCALSPSNRNLWWNWQREKRPDQLSEVRGQLEGHISLWVTLIMVSIILILWVVKWYVIVVGLQLLELRNKFNMFWTASVSFCSVCTWSIINKLLFVLIVSFYDLSYASWIRTALCNELLCITFQINYKYSFSNLNNRCYVKQLQFVTVESV